ncbi:MAG TPA: thioredoxin domain-containing protein, partial [Candidatus Synoicihabitans sp.]|nr:thioredoxin domain-containing protein [Candidatus Synoicihabitans sp.]
GRGANEGFAEDYAALIAGLLDLFEASFEVRWLRWAEALQRAMDERFLDRTRGGYFQAAAGDASIVLRLKDDHDGAEPSANSLAASNLLRLGGFLHEARWTEQGRSTLRAFQPIWSRSPSALPAMLGALEHAVEPERQIVLVGDRESPDFRALRAEVFAKPLRRRVLLGLTGAADETWLTERTPALAAMRERRGPATAYVCEGFTCDAPVTTPEALRSLLDR